MKTFDGKVAIVTIEAIICRRSAVKRLGDAEEAADAVAWLCSNAARFANDIVLPVDGGDTSRLH